MNGTTRSLATVVALALVFSACDDKVTDFLYEGEVIQAVDMHLHVGEWSQIPPPAQEELANNFPFPFNLDPGGLAEDQLTTEGIVAELDKANLRRGVVLAVYAPHSVGIATNEQAIKQVSEAPDRLYGLASLRVDRWETDAAAELALLEDALSKPGMIGVKMAHVHMHIRMDDPRYYSIYEVAGRMGKPLYLHTGNSPFVGTLESAPYADPAYLEEAIRTHPEATFILGHMGFDFINRTLGDLETCLTLAKRYPNVFLEPSALGSNRSDPEGEKMRHVMNRVKEMGLIDRVIYGSDGPQFPGFLQSYAGKARDAMVAANYTTAEADLVMGGNFERVFGVKR